MRFSIKLINLLKKSKEHSPTLFWDQDEVLPREYEEALEYQLEDYDDHKNQISPARYYKKIELLSNFEIDEDELDLLGEVFL